MISPPKVQTVDAGLWSQPVDLGYEAVARIGVVATFAAQDCGDPATAAAVSVDDVGECAGPEVTLAPIGQCGQDGQQIEPCVRQHVLIARSPPRYRVGPSCEDAGFGQPAKSIGDDLPGCGGGALDLVETSQAEGDLTDDEQSPTITYGSEDGCDAIDHGSKSRL